MNLFTILFGKTYPFLNNDAKHQRRRGWKCWFIGHKWTHYGFVADGELLECSICGRSGFKAN